ncbi:MAG TPA: flavodoxin family protein [Candidatus Limnocylindria bacterium]|nr:flavodoxin family protein [Candidatus Limnocylindria bacterium]
MKSLVYYATHSGNTERIACGIADALRAHGEVELRGISHGWGSLTDDVDLVMVGGPTEGHGMIPEVVEFLDALPDGALAGRTAAAFDTRLGWPRWASGSAAAGIRRRLELAGPRGPVASESFIVSMRPTLQPGELERAAAWADGVASALLQPAT